jgi:hypothetical protein
VTLQALKFPPGVVRIGTDGMARGRWWNANLMRWRNGGLVPIGGWDRLTNAPLSGPARKMLAWRSARDIRYVAIGTDTQLLLLDGDQIFDKTPDDFVSLPTGSFTEGGYGTGPYNYSTYDTPRDSGAFGPGGNPYSRGAIWSIDTFGEDILTVASSDGRLLHMSPNSTDTVPTFDAVAVPVADAPVNNRAVIVTDERHVMLIGAGGNPRAVAWCSREDFNDWDFTNPNNTAGFIELDTQSALVNAVKVRGGILIWTEKEVWLATYKGLPAIYGFECIGESCGMVGSNAFAVVAGNAFWCGFNTFWTWTNGVVAPVPCDVSDYLFRRTDIKSLGLRMVGGANGRFTEAWWFFPEAGSFENTSYIMTNYVEGWWSIGRLDRSCLDGAGVWPLPLMGGVDGHIYQHESGWLAAGATRNGSVWVESAAQQMPPGGDRCLNILGGQLDSGTGYDAAELRAFTRETHDDPVEYEEGPFQAYADGWIECRFSGRDIRLRIEQIKDQHWTIGEMRFDIIAGRGR